MATVNPKIMQFGQGSPRALLVAGIHGDEKTGTIVLERLARMLPHEKLQGTITMIPIANPVAYEAGTRLHPADKRDLNREFMNQGNSGPTPLLARFLEDIASRHELVIDFHVFPHQQMPVMGVFLPEGTPGVRHRSFELLLHADPEAVWVLDAREKEPEKHGSLCSFALHQNIPAFGFELPPLEGVSEYFLDVLCQKIRSVLCAFGSIPGIQSAPPRVPPCYERSVYRSAVSGVFTPMRSYSTGVQVGMVLGNFESREGLDTVRSHTEGTLLTISYPRIVAQGDKLYTIGTRVPIPE